MFAVRESGTPLNFWRFCGIFYALVFAVVSKVRVSNGVFVMTKTRLSIIRRMNGSVPARSVPKFVQDAIDIVIDLFREEVFQAFPRSNDPDIEETRYWQRIDFYKKKVMSAFLREYHTDDLDRLLRGRSITTGMAAIFFHQYVAAIKRACDTGAPVEIDCPLSVDVGDIQMDGVRTKHGYVFN